MQQPFQKFCLKAFSIFSIVNSIFIALPSQAQITSDGTLPTNSLINTQGTNTLIEGGTIRARNLFHSFLQFSVQKGGNAYFNNAQTIQNIISRITGNNISRIDGLIRANGQANLFIINPKGVIFGPNTRLDLGGSFFTSTATSVIFSDGLEFGTNVQKTQANLSIREPVGLRFIGQSGTINVFGDGYSLSRRDPLISPFLGAGQNTTGLKVSPGKTLAIIGNEINLNGGVLEALFGNIVIGSISSGEVRFDTELDNWDFKNIDLFEGIQLSNNSLLDASGSGNISIYGNNIGFFSGSVALIQNFSQAPSGNINVFSSGEFSLDGISTNGLIPTTITTESVSSGKSGDILITAKRVKVQNGASISSRTYASGIGGDIKLNSEKSVDVIGFSEVNPGIISLINSSTVTFGKSGDININTNSLTAKSGGIIIALTLGKKDAGDVNISANHITVDGANSIGLVSSISSNSFGFGNSGSIKIKASTLKLLEGGTLNAIGFSDGNAGDIYVDTDKSILIKTSPEVEIPFDTGLGIRQSGITTSVSRPSLFYQNIFNITEAPSGNAGRIFVNTPELNLSRGAIISTNRSTGLGGQIAISANSISLDSSAFSTVSFNGSGSEIFVDSNILLLKNRSSINASTGEPLPRREANGTFIFLNASDLGIDAPVNQGTGGNISINTDLLVARDSSSVSANSTGSFGGTIKINTKGLFLTEDSEITASSKEKPQLDGIVEVNAERTGAEETTIPAPDLEISPQVTSACNPSTGASKFVAMGPGALKVEPNQSVSTDLVLDTLLFPTASNSQVDQVTTGSPVVEATGWKNEKGKLFLTADKQADSTYLSSNSETCNRS